jgi:hypothetical protein
MFSTHLARRKGKTVRTYRSEHVEDSDRLDGEGIDDNIKTCLMETEWEVALGVWASYR